MGNALRHMILKNPEVKFCGYALPHPNERKINIQVQVYSGEALDAFEKGLRDLIELNKVVREAIVAEYERYGPVELVDSDEGGEDDDQEQDDNLGEEEQEQGEQETSTEVEAGAKGDTATVAMEEEW